MGLVEQGPGSVQLVGGSERGAVPGEVVAVIVLCPVPVGEVRSPSTVYVSAGSSNTREAWARPRIASDASAASVSGSRNVGMMGSPRLIEGVCSQVRGVSLIDGSH